MRYGSVCSGIEAATCAWHPLGWKPVFFSEIDKTASRFLAAKYPHVPNHGDMTKFKEWPDHAIDLLVGGTPCQSFSIAGLRKGLADPRGNLMLTYLAIADRYRPQWLVWENVPGVLSSGGGRDFGALLGGLAELGYGFAYAVRDAQYIRVESHPRAVPQRRRRVFVVGCAGGRWQRAAAVLFERESLSGHPPPRRETGKGLAPTIASRPTGGGGLGTDFDCDGGLVASTGGVSHCLNGGGMGRIDYETETMIAHALRGEGHDASEDGTGRGVPLIVDTLVSNGDAHSGFRDERGLLPIAIQERAVSENPDAGPQGKGWRDDGVVFTMEATGGTQAVAFDMRGREGGAQFEGLHDTANIRAASGGSSRSFVAHQWAVRRLTPLECTRLQGFPDDYFSSARLNKPLADGNIYKMLGNSMAVNVMSWIGHRIASMEAAQ